MKSHSSSSVDRISELPCNIQQTILMSLSLRDMVRTSILSRNWRFRWTRVPQLLFDVPRKIYTFDEVFRILLLHEGPILKFTLNMVGWDNYFKINEIIRYLSRNGIQDLTISKTNDECYTLPSSIFSCAGLKHLRLYSCVFKRLALDGFNKLITLKLVEVELDSHVCVSSCPLLESLKMIVLTNVDQFSVDAPRLKILSFRGSISHIGFMNTPLLKDLSLSFNDYDSFDDKTFGLMRFLCSLPHLENLLLYFSFLKCLTLGVSPNKLPTVLNSLKKLELVYVDLDKKEELSSTLWLIRNSPNLQIIVIETLDSGSELELDSEMLHYYDFYLAKLEEVELVLGGNVPRAVLQFLMFLLDVSPVLEKLYIGPYSIHPDEEQSKEMLDLACYPRASPKAEIVFKSE